MDVITRGVFEIIPEDDLVKKLERSIATNSPLIIKLGCDPSRPDLHLGHSVVLRKLRQFQDLGHHAILIVGDFTGIIGDPSGRNKTRPALSLKETRLNGRSYFEQATKILSKVRVTMCYNSEWLGAMKFEDVIKLAGKYTVARILERDDFMNRFRNNESISIHEFLYPLAQAMDSVAIQSDVELGGTDQKFNLLVGRDIQREYNQEPQVILTMPILPGTDGIEKMSKSLDNYIGISEPPQQIYGKTLSIPDTMIIDYFTLCTSIAASDLDQMRDQLASGTVNPRDLKRRLARELVTQYYTADDALRAEEDFDALFIRKEIPEDIDEYRLAPGTVSIQLLKLMVDSKLTASNNEGRRLIQQGGVSIDGKRIDNEYEVLTIIQPVIIKVGKRRFMKITPS
ncbi:MAG: tyrosine--tRNA ligase [Bacteroidota bacterium]